MKKLAIIFLVFSFCDASFAQNISRHEADSLFGALKRSKADTARISLLLQLAEFQIFKPGEFKQDLDSAAAYIEKAKRLNAQLKPSQYLGFTTLVEACLIREKGQTDAAQKMVERSIEIAGREKDLLHLAQAYFELSSYYDYKIPEQLPEKIKLVEQAVSSYQQTGNKERLGFTLKVLADLYDGTNEPSKVLETLDRSLEAYKSINYTQLQPVYVIYASVYYERGNYKQALSYELLALKSAESANDTSLTLCQIHNVMGVILSQLGDREKSVYHYKIALQIAEKYNSSADVLIMLMSIVHSYSEAGKPEEGLKVLRSVPGKFLIPKNDASYYVVPMAYLTIYHKLKNYPKAQVYADQLTTIVKDHTPETRNLASVYSMLIAYYVSSGQFKAASNYLEKMDLLSKKIGDPSIINRTNFQKFRLDTALGNFKSATYILLNYNKINDSLFNETKSKQIKELEINYETQKKEDSIKIQDNSITVLNQKTRLQDASLERAGLLRKITFAGIAVLLLIMGLFYRQYRNKQHTTQVILLKNELLEHLVKEKEWLLKEVHHRVKNNLQTVVSLLELQSENLGDEALSVIHQSQNRIYAMSLIHQKLYQSDNIASINMENYLKELTGHLREIYNVGPSINIQCNVGDFEMDVSQAVPVGLIVNEAVTNSIKYAFSKASKNPEINISLNNKNDNQVELVVTDNGAGLPPGFANDDKNGLGFKLMKGLAEDIEGTLTIESVDGTQIRVSFNASIPFQETNTMTTAEKTVAA